MAGNKHSNGEGTIWWDAKRKRWIGRVSIPGTAGTKRREVSAKSRVECEQKLQRLRAEVSGLTFTPATLTFGEHLDNWLETSVRDTVKLSTYRRYEDLIRNHLKPHLGQVKLKHLTAAHLQTLYAKKRDKLAPGTIKLMHTVASSSLKKARKWKLIASNPAEDADAPRNVVQRESRALSREEAVSLLGKILAWRKDRYALFLLAVTTGMRQGEILGLRWSDVDLKKGEAVVKRTADTWSGPPSFRSPKGGKPRTVTLGTLAVAALKVHRRDVLEERMRAKKWKDRDLVFPGPQGDVLRRSGVYEAFKRFLRREGFPDMTFHELRHSTATILLEDGEGIKAVQDLLGHADVRTTLNTYGHVTESMRSSTAARMDSLLGNT